MQVHAPESSLDSTGAMPGPVMAAAGMIPSSKPKLPAGHSVIEKGMHADWWEPMGAPYVSVGVAGSAKAKRETLCVKEWWPVVKIATQMISAVRCRITARY